MQFKSKFFCIADLHGFPSKLDQLETILKAEIFQVHN